ncbi:hypothetical protein ETB97_003998 [Aspergillus alliaceus]|uniref:Xylanolytic transcriptional activator regulatory domain-containing protein n=1 Tax=Petromyces alliaceus TaxID=209559 RepID=A0A8H6ECH1_PETAA|nr:hypothetical protein ETB97_003998 [Aspergillus burnettii]
MSSGVESESVLAEMPGDTYMPENPLIVDASTSHNGLVLYQLAPVLSDNSAEYLGPTSFTSVFMEHRDHFDVENALKASSDKDAQESSQPRLHHHDLHTSSQLLQIGTQVLLDVPDERSCKILFLKHINPNDGWIRLAGHILSDMMWSSFRTTLNGRHKEQLTDLSRLIFKNSMTPLVPTDNPDQWLKSFAGSNLRWESLGILFTYWAFGAISSSPESDILSQYREKREYITDLKQLMVHFKNCALLCIELCRQCSSVNALTVYLMYKHNILESIISGDKSLKCWRQHGELIAVTTCIGIHRESNQDSQKVTLQREMNRRVCAAVFNIDKVLSAFTGRPPLLNRLHTSTKLPLDISDDVLLSAKLQESVAKLDDNGWNQNGHIYSTTILRARTLFAKIREEILEITLDFASQSALERALALKNETLSVYEQLPASITYSASDIEKLDAPGDDLYARILTRLEFLLNNFLLERLLTRNSIVHAQQDITDVSREMLELTLIFWRNQSYFTGLHSDFEWLVMSYAVPSSGILCLELLRQTNHSEIDSSRLPRSEVIQNLSLLVGFLDWLRPTTSSRDLNLFITRILRRVLDRILDTPPRIGDLLPEPHPFLDPFLQNGAYEGPDYHNEFLNTFDWVGWDRGCIDIGPS